MRVKLLIFAVPLVLLTITYYVYPCTCRWTGPFFKVAHRAALIALIKVDNYVEFYEDRRFRKEQQKKFPLAMEVEIIDIFRGEENRKKVKVWGDNGQLCRPYINKFKMGSTWVIALFNGEKGTAHKHEKSDDYYVSICGEYYVQVRNDSVFGLLTKEEYSKQPEATTFKDFKQKAKRIFSESRPNTTVH